MNRDHTLMRVSGSSPKRSRQPARPDPHLTAIEQHLRQRGHLVVARQKEAELYRWTTRQRWLWQCGLLDRTIERGLHAIGFPFEVEDCEREQEFGNRSTSTVVDGGVNPA